MSALDGHRRVVRAVWTRALFYGGWTGIAYFRWILPPEHDPDDLSLGAFMLLQIAIGIGLFEIPAAIRRFARSTAVTVEGAGALRGYSERPGRLATWSRKKWVADAKVTGKLEVVGDELWVRPARLGAYDFEPFEVKRPTIRDLYWHEGAGISSVASTAGIKMADGARIVLTMGQLLPRQVRRRLEAIALIFYPEAADGLGP